jgi:hypothetical protein
MLLVLTMASLLTMFLQYGNNGYTLNLITAASLKGASHLVAPCTMSRHDTSCRSCTANRSTTAVHCHAALL